MEYLINPFLLHGGFIDADVVKTQISYVELLPDHLSESLYATSLFEFKDSDL